ncbi:GRB10-interacting GYF protein 2 [Cyclospora cayetanensis]|uniref:GRB10-interacting GYF protein 2 n=1 Tax=Cyclospora cayetanensis TaxID=88456 RepID=A0A6P6RWR4_9EIME|nr:GRB10-interacting GYF protein 2 [Cyclospora cayetanensis]
MHNLLAEPHKLAVASKYGLVRVVSEDENHALPPTIERHIEPWRLKEARSHWKDLESVFGYAPWSIMGGGGGLGNFIPASLATRLREKLRRGETLGDGEGSGESTEAGRKTAPRQASRGRSASASPRKTPFKRAPAEAASATGAAGEVNSSSLPPAERNAVAAERNASRTPTRATAAPTKSKQQLSCDSHHGVHPLRTPTSSSRLLRKGILAEESAPKAAASGAPETGGMQATSAAPKDASAHLRESSCHHEDSAVKHVASTANASKDEAQQLPAEGAAARPAVPAPDPPASESGRTAEAASAENLQQAALQPSTTAQTAPSEGRSLEHVAANPRQKPRQADGTFSLSGPRQMKLTELFRLTLRKVRGKLSFAGAESVWPSAPPSDLQLDDEASEDDVFRAQKKSRRRKCIDEDTLLLPQYVPPRPDGDAAGDQPEQASSEAAAEDALLAVGGGAGVSPRAAPAENDSLPQETPAAEDDSEAVDRQEKKRRKELKRKQRDAELKRQRRLERKQRMREIVRQMVEYEAEENDEELREDAEYAAALQELKHRLAREGDDEEDELEDSDTEFLEDLVARPEDADEEERNEDREAMNMKLQRDLSLREEEVYERLIGRYQRNANKEGTELTEQEMLELEMEERRRKQAKRRKLLGDGAFADLEIDDWLSESSGSGSDSREDEEETAEDSAEGLVRWSSLALEGAANAPGGTTLAAAAPPVNPADLVARCHANASRRQQIQQLRESRKRRKLQESGKVPVLRGAGESAGFGQSKQSANLPSPPKQSGEDRESHAANSSDSDDEMENLYRSASLVQTIGGTVKGPLQKAAVGGMQSSCIRFNPNYQPDFELANSSSRTVAPVFSGFRSRDTRRKTTNASPGQAPTSRYEFMSETLFSRTSIFRPSHCTASAARASVADANGDSGKGRSCRTNFDPSSRAGAANKVRLSRSLAFCCSGCAG